MLQPTFYSSRQPISNSWGLARLNIVFIIMSARQGDGDAWTAQSKRECAGSAAFEPLQKRHNM
jgi:hypothetical protein